MAALTPAQADCGVLEDEGSLFFAMALEADLLAGEARLKLLVIDATVRLVTVGARHGILLDPVMEGLGEVGLLLGMATQPDSLPPDLLRDSEVFEPFLRVGDAKADPTSVG